MLHLISKDFVRPSVTSDLFTEISQTYSLTFDVPTIVHAQLVVLFQGQEDQGQNHDAGSLGLRYTRQTRAPHIKW